MKVFVIDDCEISLLLTTHLLNLAGIDLVKTFAGGEKALDYLVENGPEALPDAILLDLNMPGMDGWEFLESLGATGRLALKDPCRIYILTSSIDPADAAKASTYVSVYGFFHKPLQQIAIKTLQTGICLSLQEINQTG
jgi:CheY-like chemotaxis protein